MSYSTQNLGSLMDDLGAEEGAGGGKSKAKRSSDGQAFWKSQGFVIALALVAVLVLVGGTWYSFFSGGGPKPPSSMMMIDVQSGQLFEARLGNRGYVVPAKNPDTGERTLFPVTQSEYGEWTLDGRDTEHLESENVNPQVVPSLSNLVVIPSSEKTKAYRR